MKLLRATCDCGFVTRKARTGYHHDKWWFPLFSTDTGKLTDVQVDLPIADRDRIDRQQVELYCGTLGGKPNARREASAKMTALEEDIRRSFIDRETIVLQKQYASDDSSVFNPPLPSTLRCPACGHGSLVLAQVEIIAICKADCGHEYQWADSEMNGCPSCGDRPHRFRTEHEPRFADRPRAVCSCPCSSSTEAASHVDGYCPKCGELPDSYEVDEVVYCGTHHQRLVTYFMPANFLFIETELRWASHLFPHAKWWGDASTNEKRHEGVYCPKCESDHQDWVAVGAKSST